MPLRLYRRPGSKIWHYRGTVGPAGKRQRLRESCFTTDKDIAARQIAEIEKRYWDGHFDGPAAILTFEQACIQFLADGKPCMVGTLDVVQAARDYFKKEKIVYVKDITSKKIRAMADELYGHCTGASKNRLAVSPVQSVINHCAENDLCSFIRVKRFPQIHKEKEPATLRWVQDFRAATKPHLGAYALFMFLTGARPSEGLAIDREKDLNLQAAEATIRMTKVEKDKLVTVTRTPHLPAILVAALANLDPVPTRPLFVYRKYGDMIETWRGAVERAKLPVLTPHCCRHGFATELLRRGVDVWTVAWLGGWASAKQVLETYGHAVKRRSITDVLASPAMRAAFDDVTHNALEITKMLSGYSDEQLRAELARRSVTQNRHDEDDAFRQVTGRTR
ncbi:tyrosine-type recombinase/integrase [Bradyrhizobium tropiciagri]|uniref:tyrosine-type recombinase/integrase n=1 Tax=Bradyrhizobium tropiciagri TaxID=312253 RepID=UPI001BAB0175|nr:tyrosine-type recombinase/integrase [Bradyrhizobium tropiciagri]MBR0868890.1 tyrosine-type recombinase/integrase [Bradyrhizobium tropiciagri]